MSEAGSKKLANSYSRLDIRELNNKQFGLCDAVQWKSPLLYSVSKYQLKKMFKKQWVFPSCLNPALKWQRQWWFDPIKVRNIWYNCGKQWNSHFCFFIQYLFECILCQYTEALLFTVLTESPPSLVRLFRRICKTKLLTKWTNKEK